MSLQSMWPLSMLEIGLTHTLFAALTIGRAGVWNVSSRM